MSTAARASSDAELRTRLQFHGVVGETGAVLKRHQAFVLQALPPALDALYDVVAAEPAAAKFFRDRTHMAHAKEKQLAHWRMITDGLFDEKYRDSVHRIGRIHNKIGLGPSFYIGGYNRLLVALHAAVAQAFAGSWLKPARQDEMIALQSALTKAVCLDMDFSISVYLEEGKRERMELLARISSEFETKVGGVVDQVGQAATTLGDMADKMAESSKLALNQTSEAARGAREASTNVQTVAAASEELSSSITEIGRQVTDATKVAAQAATDAERTSGEIRELSQAAQKIGEVVELINTIAGQTNLLALNATIEAARAGEAGKGFAVVASEVKLLADQTAKATSTIGNQIAAIQSGTAKAVDAVNQISHVIQRINAISTSIASAVDEQGAATREIARNVAEAFSGTSSVSANVEGVSRSAASSVDVAKALDTATTGLGETTNRLRDAIRDFMTSLKAA